MNKNLLYYCVVCLVSDLVAAVLFTVSGWAMANLLLVGVVIYLIAVAAGYLFMREYGWLTYALMPWVNMAVLVLIATLMMIPAIRELTLLIYLYLHL